MQWFKISCLGTSVTLILPRDIAKLLFEDAISSWSPSSEDDPHPVCKSRILESLKQGVHKGKEAQMWRSALNAFCVCTGKNDLCWYWNLDF